MEEHMSPTCEQANELIAYLYGELTDVESRAFQGHMHGCSSCSEELAAFGNIRSSVVAWRDEALAGISSSAARQGVAVGRKNPSALAALREFFNLSPLWMKGAVAFASLLFVLFAGLAVARWQNPPSPITSNTLKTDSTAYSEQQLNALVEQRVQLELQRIKNSTQELPAPQTVADGGLSSVSTRRAASRANVVAKIAPARRPLSKVEREQLAADLRLVAANTDNELDLLDDRINQ